MAGGMAGGIAKISKSDYSYHNRGSGMKEIGREILLGFWKAQILHDASKGPVVGQWVLRELRQRGYEVSPGTVYPLLKRMEQRGWLRCDVDPKTGARGRRSYHLTEKGGEVLVLIRRHLGEMCRGSMLTKAGKSPCGIVVTAHFDARAREHVAHKGARPGS